MEFKGKNVAVTGSGRGIGLAIAKAFSKKGAFVILNCSRNVDELKAAANEIKADGGSCAAIAGDVSDYEICQRITGASGGIDILINNAAVASIGLFTDMKPCEWEKMLGVNLTGAINCTHAALPHMVRQKSGVIINISSMWGERGASCEAVYSASKGGLNAFTKAIAKEYGPSGIRCNAIACGVIETSMIAQLDDEARDSLIDEIPMCRFGAPEEVAETAVFLAGKGASYINGQIIGADGGI